MEKSCSFSLVAALAFLGSAPGSASSTVPPEGVPPQQVIEIDYSAGRTIIDDEWRAMKPSDVGVDWCTGSGFLDKVAA